MTFDLIAYQSVNDDLVDACGIDPGQICEWIYENMPYATLAVNTNLSRPLKWWQKHAYLFDDIVASFHVEQCNKERYEENSMWLCENVNYLSTKILLHE